MFSKVVTIKPAAISKKRDARNALALDAENNNISVKDIVKVIDGPHSVGQISNPVTRYKFMINSLLTLCCVLFSKCKCLFLYCDVDVSGSSRADQTFV